MSIRLSFFTALDAMLSEYASHSEKNSLRLFLVSFGYFDRNGCPLHTRVVRASIIVINILFIIADIVIKVYLAIKIRITVRTRKPRNSLARLLSAWSMLLKSSDPYRICRYDTFFPRRNSRRHPYRSTAPKCKITVRSQ